MYGPVRTVVWEGEGRKAFPYPDSRQFNMEYRAIATRYYPGEGNSYQFAVFIGNRTFLKLAAHDTGNGIAIEISDMIFDPFLTAK